MSENAENCAPPAVLPLTPRTTLKRRPARGSHERAAIEAILDEAFVCHLGVSLADGPHVLPTAHVRVGNSLYVHGARRNQLLCAAASGAPVVVTVTLIDGLVFSREAFHHSMNYRSVVLFGAASEVHDPDEKLAALRALVNHTAPGRYDEVIPPTPAEVDSTLVLRFAIEEGSAKVRSGPPLDPADQADGAMWAGELPLALRADLPRVDALDAVPPLLSPSVAARARTLGLGVRAPYELREGELLISTDPARLDLGLVHAFLSRESYWAAGVTEAALRASCEASLCFGVYRGKEQLAFARVVSDMARFAYLADVFVIPSERGKGLGKLLVARLFEHPALCDIERWLLGTRDAHDLYARFGFVEVPAGRYMVRRREAR